MELKEAIEKAKKLVEDNYMSDTENEAVAVVLQELESARKFIDEEEETIVEKNNKICELEYKNIELQKENEGIKARVDKYLQGGNETLRLEHEETLKYYHENYISKDKIKEKIEELGKIKANILTSIEKTIEKASKQVLWDRCVRLEGKIKVLEELLKGE